MVDLPPFDGPISTMFSLGLTFATGAKLLLLPPSASAAKASACNLASSASKIIFSFIHLGIQGLGIDVSSPGAAANAILLRSCLR